MHIGMLLYPGLTQLDLTGPFEVFHRIPGARIHLPWKERGVIRSDAGLGLEATVAFADCPPLDLLFVPGGQGQVPLMTDEVVLGFLRQQAGQARLITSVCTGALLLGAAGLLQGYEAATHWAYLDLLPLFGAKPVSRRVVIDRDRITAGGVTAGIDFGLTLLARLAGDDVAKQVQLQLEYDPSPPFRSGHPSVAEPAVLEAVRQSIARSTAERRAQVAQALAGGPR